jgi:hypothetical protein
VIFITEFYGDVTPESGAARADIHRNVKNAPAQNHHQLALRLRVL